MIDLYTYQKQAVNALLSGKHFLISNVGTGKTIMSLEYARRTGKKNVLVITTAGVRDAQGFERDAVMFSDVWYKSLSSFIVVSWAGLAKWLKTQTSSNQFSLSDWVIIGDEIACMKAGVSSQRGKAFLNIAKLTDTWIGMTATPGDKWIDFYAYLCAAGLVRNKTAFLKEYCKIQTFKGFPEIVGYNHEDRLAEMWASISYTPDTSAVIAELPAETHKTIHFKQPKGYRQTMKTRCTIDGDPLDSTPAYCHYLRQLCASDQKRQWLADYIEHLGSRAVVFYNYTEEGNHAEETIKKAVGKRGRVWRIDGHRHEIPTEQTSGNRDVVLVQWQAGAMGLNLQFINYWVSLSPCYSYSISVQGRGRIKRIGQTKHMDFKYCLCDNTIEEAVYKCLKNKSDFAEEVWDLGKEKNETD